MLLDSIRDRRWIYSHRSRGTRPEDRPMYFTLSACQSQPRPWVFRRTAKSAMWFASACRRRLLSPIRHGLQQPSASGDASCRRFATVYSNHRRRETPPTGTIGVGRRLLQQPSASGDASYRNFAVLLPGISRLGGPRKTAHFMMANTSPSFMMSNSSPSTSTSVPA